MKKLYTTVLFSLLAAAIPAQQVFATAQKELEDRLAKAKEEVKNLEKEVQKIGSQIVNYPCTRLEELNAKLEKLVLKNQKACLEKLDQLSKDAKKRSNSDLSFEELANKIKMRNSILLEFCSDVVSPEKAALQNQILAEERNIENTKQALREKKSKKEQELASAKQNMAKLQETLQKAQEEENRQLDKTRINSMLQWAVNEKLNIYENRKKAIDNKHKKYTQALKNKHAAINKKIKEQSEKDDKNFIKMQNANKKKEQNQLEAIDEKRKNAAIRAKQEKEKLQRQINAFKRKISLNEEKEKPIPSNIKTFPTPTNPKSVGKRPKKIKTQENNTLHSFSTKPKEEIEQQDNLALLDNNQPNSHGMNAGLYQNESFDTQSYEASSSGANQLIVTIGLLGFVLGGVGVFYWKTLTSAPEQAGSNKAS